MREHPEFSTGTSQMTRGKEYHYFIEVMMKALIPLRKITSKQLDRAYAMTSDDLSYELESEGKKNLFQFMLKMKRILEVEKSTAMHRYDLVGIDQNDNTCIVDWKTGQKYVKDIEQVSQYINECEDIQVGYLIYLDLNEQIKIDKKQDGKKDNDSTSKEDKEAKSAQEDLKSGQTRLSPREEEKLLQNESEMSGKDILRKSSENFQSQENILNQFFNYENVLRSRSMPRRREIYAQMKERALSSKTEYKRFNFTENGTLRKSQRKKLQQNILQPRRKQSEKLL